MLIPSWLVWLSAELLIIFLAVIVWQIIARYLTIKKYRIQLIEKTEKLRKQSALLNDFKQQLEQLPIYQKEIEQLKLQLQQEKNNPFLQDKIDALIVENEDLQEQITSLKNQSD